jgi:hypothetical protein
MDAAQLDAFANGGPKPSAADMMDDDPDATEGGEEQSQNSRDFSALITLITEFGDALEACCDELDPETLADPEMPMESDDLMILQEGYNGLDRKLQKELNAAMPFRQEEADQIAEELEASGAIEDADRVAGYLMRLNQLGQGHEEPDGDEVAGAESDEDGDEYDEYD